MGSLRGTIYDPLLVHFLDPRDVQALHQGIVDPAPDPGKFAQQAVLVSVDPWRLHYLHLRIPVLLHFQQFGRVNVVFRDHMLESRKVQTEGVGGLSLLHGTVRFLDLLQSFNVQATSLRPTYWSNHWASLLADARFHRYLQELEVPDLATAFARVSPWNHRTFDELLTTAADIFLAAVEGPTKSDFVLTSHVRHPVQVHCQAALRRTGIEPPRLLRIPAVPYLRSLPSLSHMDDPEKTKLEHSNLTPQEVQRLVAVYFHVLIDTQETELGHAGSELSKHFVEAASKDGGSDSIMGILLQSVGAIVEKAFQRTPAPTRAGVPVSTSQVAPLLADPKNAAILRLLSLAPGTVGRRELAESIGIGKSETARRLASLRRLIETVGVGPATRYRMRRIPLRLPTA